MSHEKNIPPKATDSSAETNIEIEQSQTEKEMEVHHYAHNPAAPIVDVIAVLTESPNPNNYWKLLKQRLARASNQLITNCNQLKMESSHGKFIKPRLLIPNNSSAAVNSYHLSK